MVNIDILSVILIAFNSTNIILYIYPVPPYIEIHNVILNVTLNSTALLECKIEAFPRGVYYWETAQGKLLEQSTDRFLVDYKHNGLYEVRFGKFQL